MLKYFESKTALGCNIDLVIVSSSNKQEIKKLFNKLWLEIFLFEQRCSRFLLTSELTIFNQNAGQKQSISPEFKEVLEAAYAMAELTGGTYNPFVLPALQKSGYVKSMVKKHSSDETKDFSDRSMTKYTNLLIGGNWAEIPFGTAIDLGGCGKGYIGDKLSEVIKAYSFIDGYYFSLGGDVIVEGIDSDQKPWQVSIEGLSKTEAGYIRAKPNTKLCVATSSTNSRKGVSSGKKWHHIIDPSTSKPSETNVITASVVSESLLTADVLASSAIIYGSTKTKKELSKLGSKAFLLQNKNNKLDVWGDIKLRSVKTEKVSSNAIK